MNLLEFIRVILRHWKILVFLPICTALVVFILTRNTKKEYVSNAQVYTGIASGYGITSGEDDRIDYFAVNNAFDNLMATIKSRETMEEVGMRLLAEHLLIKEPAYDKISQENFDHLKESVPEDLRRKLVVKNNVELTFFRIESYRRANDANEIINIITSPGEIYSADNIMSSMSAVRKQSSDMIDLSYKSNDPAVCQQTLTYLVEVVIKRYKGIKGSETNNVVKYFEEQLALAAARLRKSEDKLRDYSSDNKIINYYEQAKFVAESKENVTMDKQKQKMSLEATKAALKKVEDKIDLKKNLLIVNDNISRLRTRLSEVNYKIANAELEEMDASNLSVYKAEAENLKKLIKAEVEKNYQWNNTPEGLPRQNLLNEWLNNYLAVDENTEKLNVIQERLDGFDNIYTQLAPIGSNLKRIEREVDVNEKEYLSVLHGLNMAKLRQQSLQMSNNLTITDYPFLPLKPLPSKRMLLVIMAFLATFIVTLATILAKALLGKAIQTPGRAEKFTGLQFLSALPDYRLIDKTILVEKMDEALLSQMSSDLFYQIKQSKSDINKAVLIGVGSNKVSEGKSFVINKLSEVLASKYNNVVWITNSDYIPTHAAVKQVKYSSIAEVKNIESIYEWLEDQNIITTENDLILFEYTEYTKYNLPECIFNNAALTLFILDAERVWTDADARALNFYNKNAFNKSFIILNNVEANRLESIIGEIPKQRTKIRKMAKRTITLNFRRA